MFFIFNQQNELCANEHKVRYFVAGATGWYGLHCLQAATGPAHYSLQGCISDHVGKIASHSGKEEMTSHQSETHLLQLFQQATSSKSISSLCPFISLNKIKKWLFVFENI